MMLTNPTRPTCGPIASTSDAVTKAPYLLRFHVRAISPRNSDTCKAPGDSTGTSALGGGTTKLPQLCGAPCRALMVVPWWYHGREYAPNVVFATPFGSLRCLDPLAGIVFIDVDLPPIIVPLVKLKLSVLEVPPFLNQWVNKNLNCGMTQQVSFLYSTISLRCNRHAILKRE